MKNYVKKAVDAFEESLNSGRAYHWIVVPKGGGATNLAFEIVKKVGKKTLIIVGDDPSAKFNVEKYAKSYFTSKEEYRFEIFYEKVSMLDCNSVTSAKVLIIERKNFNLRFLADIEPMCELVIYLDCERAVESNADEKVVFSKLKEKGAIIIGITSVLDPRIGLTFGSNPISTHVGELPTYELSLSELSYWILSDDEHKNNELPEVRKAIEEVVSDYADGTYLTGITDSSTFVYGTESGPKDLVDKLEQTFAKLLTKYS